MSLAEKLKEKKAGFVSQVPAEVLEKMMRAGAELKDSGIAERALGVGAKAPTFNLENQDGTTVSSEELLGKGPMILTFYRGKW